jgi:hypothetical protein
LQELLSVVIKGLTTNIFESSGGLSLYRAIKYADKPLLVAEISYPPKEYAKINRANDMGEQVFYCSTIKKVPFYELNADVGDKLIISRWTNVAPLILNNIGYQNEELHELARNYQMEYCENINTINQINEDNRNAISFFKNAFSKKIEAQEYKKLTIAIARKFYDTSLTFKNRTTEWSGLLYHTTRLDGVADNIVLKKEILDFGLVIVQEIEYVEIIEVKNDRYVYKLLDFAYMVEDGKIKWINPVNTWIMTDETEDFYFGETESGFALYTADGEIIKPS